MKQIVINVEENKLQFFMELIKSLDFAQVDEQSGDFKGEIMDSLDQSFKDLKLYKEGKLEAIPAKKFTVLEVDSKTASNYKFNRDQANER